MTERPDVSHYQNEEGGYEPIDYIADQGWMDAYCRGNVIKYVTRAGRKENEDPVKDLKKAIDYLNFLIQHHSDVQIEERLRAAHQKRKEVLVDHVLDPQSQTARLYFGVEDDH